MLFRALRAAIVGGVLSGFVLFLLQRWTALPLIRAAETYEITARGASARADSDSAFEKDPTRSALTLAGDLLVATGFGLLLVGAYTLSGTGGLLPGLIWGAAGFATFHLGPAMVVAPTLPGMEVAALSLRQAGWLVAAGLTGIGLALLAFCRGAARYAGILSLAAPTVLFRHLLPIPPAMTPSASLAALEQAFVARALMSSLFFWLVLGMLSGHLFAKAGGAGTAGADMAG